MNPNSHNSQSKPKVFIKGSSDNFYSLIDRLQACMLKRNPESPIWDIETYYDIAFQWMGKEKELKARVQKLESQFLD